MKKLLLSLCAVLLFISARADEGMWIPSLIGKNYDEMVRKGLKLSQQDLYSINQASLKDAVVQFAGGCTGEMISASGLLITNHHCGFGAINALSTVKNNYLENGFWAKSMAEELPAPGITVLFLQRITDVTDEVNKYIGKATGDKLNEKLSEITKKIEARENMGGKLVANVKEYFNGNQYLLITYKRYTDVRLVGTPPESLGKFGGDTDNWMWPRHTADFSMFRVYADKNNEPATYSPTNQPYQPKKFLPISIKGTQEGDYAMIFGYPGRTNRYEVSTGVDLAIKEVNPSIVSIREKRLAIMRKYMDQDKAVYLQLATQYASISNYWKYYIGQTEQLKRLNVVEKKKEQERAFIRWASKNGYDEYSQLMSEYASTYANYKPYAKHAVYYSECFKASALVKMAAAMEPLYQALGAKNPNKDSIKKYLDAAVAVRKALMPSFVPDMEQELFASTAEMFYLNVPKAQHPDIYQSVIYKKFGGSNTDKTFSDYAAYVFEGTFLTDDKAFEAFVQNPTLERLEKDPAIRYTFSFIWNYTDYYEPRVNTFANAKKQLSKTYMKGLMEMNKNKLFYPDANSTMRITYGKVLGYSPQDGVAYNTFTTLEGLMEKYQPGDDEFDVPQELITLHKKRDYGRYMDADSTLHTCFITNNDITGGNSGSPVINAHGEFIGIAFDGNWEAMSGDIAFDKKYKRTICVDARFILFIIEKMGKAHNLIEEMEIHN